LTQIFYLNYHAYAVGNWMQ